MNNQQRCNIREAADHDNGPVAVPVGFENDTTHPLQADTDRGEFGHIPLNINGPRCLCGNRGCFNASTSNLATLSRYLERELSAQARDETARYLGLGIATMNNALNPAQLIVGGEITQAWDRLEPIIRSFLVKSVAIVSLATAATQLHAQSSGAPSAESAAPVAAHANILSRHRGVSIAIIGVATTLVMRPLDEQITDAVRASSPQRSVTLRHTADVFNVIGGPGFILASASLLGGGYVSHNATITQLGVRTSEAMIVSSLATRLL